MKFDKVGEWSELKIKIVAEYAGPFSTILRAQKGFTCVYIDAFSGPGRHISRKSGEFIPSGERRGHFLHPRSPNRLLP